MRIAICDDELLCREEIKRTLFDYYNDNVTITIVSYVNGEKLLEDIMNGSRYDIVILDIFLEGRNGIDIAKEIYASGDRTNIIFITSTMDYAVDGYEVEAKGYIHKPMDRQKLFLILEKIGKNSFLTIKNLSNVEKIDMNDILYLESNAHKVTIVTNSGNEYSCWGKLSDLREQLDKEHFLQCHQSYIVNMDFIVRFNNDFVLSNGKLIPVKVKERKKMRQCYIEYIRGGSNEFKSI